MEPPTRRTQTEPRESILGTASGNARVTLAVFTLLSPISLLFVFLAALATVMSGGEPSPWPPLASVALLYNVLWTGLLVLFYAPHMMQNPSIVPAVRVFWAVGFLFAAPVALTLYWLMHLTPHPRGPSDEPERPSPRRRVRVIQLGRGGDDRQSPSRVGAYPREAE